MKRSFCVAFLPLALLLGTGCAGGPFATGGYHVVLEWGQPSTLSVPTAVSQSAGASGVAVAGLAAAPATSSVTVAPRRLGAADCQGCPREPMASTLAELAGGGGCTLDDLCRRQDDMARKQDEMNRRLLALQPKEALPMPRGQ
jgi:hypothetical protein